MQTRTGTRYGKYIIDEVPEEKRKVFKNSLFVYLSDQVIPGSFVQAFFWIRKDRETPFTLHKRHVHPHGEILAFLGADSDKPDDLGAEIELYIGEEEEKHIITKTSIVYIPENILHCPLIIKRIDRSFIKVTAAPIGTYESSIPISEIGAAH